MTSDRDQSDHLTPSSHLPQPPDESLMPEVVFPDLKDQSVFITGGGSGIGAAFTEAFLAQGAKVSFVQRSDASAFVDQLRGRYPESSVLFMPCDVTDIEALGDAIKDAAAAHGPIRVLINNAANDNRHTLSDLTPQMWDDAMNVNLRPHVFCIQAVAPMMRQSGGGSVINLSSISYLMGNASYPAYVTAKSAITGMTRALARELGPDHIRLNALLPGWVLTKRQHRLWITPEALTEHLNRQCLPRHLFVEDIVGAALFLASNASRMMTGQALVVDGGVVVTG